MDDFLARIIFRIFIDLLVGGWATPLKNMKVNWDDEIPNNHGKITNGNQTTNQILVVHDS